MEREVGGGIGMGKTCKPMADSFQCMTKPKQQESRQCEVGKRIEFSGVEHGVQK